MSEEESPDAIVERSSDAQQGEHGEMPFRLKEFEPLFSFAKYHPVATPLDTLQCEIQFQTRLAAHEWERKHWVTLAMGSLAFLLGSLSPELMNGGDPLVIGAEGIQSVSSFVFLQMLVSLVLWGWFAMQIWRMFPIMRTHAISLLVFWNLFVVAQVLYHQTNPSFPRGLVLSEMMMGTLIVLIVLFFIYFFWKAVTETRDLHIEEYHLHEDVRLMESEMAEHSLRAWGFLLLAWTATTMFSAWAGTHFIAERFETGTASLVLHIASGLASLPMFMLVIWYPQRMLGQDTVVRTRAAIAAEAELAEGGQTTDHKSGSFCPECEVEVPISRNASGAVELPCPTEGCSTRVTVGKACTSCKAIAPTRYDCPSCGINAPILDFLSDTEAW